ncbi:HD-GYP domain-containing protein [Alkalibacillus sp. S2W]|uniref:HD-GYP domain-containing protein n=1 Tax=Alkalibacillus sp. S2W TaxID=3386553 RepID=UPI00398CECC6
MRNINIENVKVNDILEQNIYNLSGARLITEGTKLQSRMIERLKKMGYRRLTIRDERFEGVDIKLQESLTEETKIKAISTTKDVLENFHQSDHVRSMEEITDVVEDILSEVLSNDDIGIDITSIQGYDLGTYTHSVSVTVLSLYLAKELGLRRSQLSDIAVGGLLHDLGKLYIPQEILNKPGKLTQEEFEVVKKHPMDGFVKIKDKISLLAAHIALQHHEKYDGTGYPRNLKGEDIHLYGRITAIADVYDAVTMDRPYRPGRTPDEAIELLMSNAGTHFDPEILPSFLKIISPYPNGKIVLLDNGDKAIVTEQNIGFPLRPILLIFQSNNQLLTEYNNLDLSVVMDITIVGVEDE